MREERTEGRDTTFANLGGFLPLMIALAVLGFVGWIMAYFL